MALGGARVLLAGFLVADIVVAGLDRVAEPGGSVVAPRGIRLCIGGHPANISIDLVKLGVRPEDIALVGTVGGDVFGEFIVRELSRHRIRLFVERRGESTNKNVILVVKGEDRRFHVEFSSSLLMEPEMVLRALDEVKPALLYMAVGITGRVDEELASLLAEAKRRGCLMFVDSVHPYGRSWAFLEEAMRYVDVYHCNERELRDFTGVDDLGEALGRVLDLGARLVFLTLGGRGAVAATKRYRVRQGAFRVRVVDPTGAGDAFCAGVIYELLRRYGEGLRALDASKLPASEIAEIVLFAQAVGAAACTAPGTTAGVSLDRVRELLEEQGEEILAGQVIEA